MPNLPAMCLTLAARRNAQAPLASVEARIHISDMVHIAISPAAFNAITATLPGSVGVENKRNAEGNWLSWLGRRILDKLNAIREPHEGLSDVILRVAEETKPVQRISLRKARPGKTLATPCGRSNLRSNR